MKKGVIIQASSRPKGDTFKMVKILEAATNFDVIDISQKKIGYFDYDFKNDNDDYKTLLTNIVDNYDTIIFATPIYWYTMSGLLKVFFDRISDFLHKHKDTGRKLRGIQMGVLSCSHEDAVFEGFTMPFIKSAEYLGMDYIGHLHTWLEDNSVSKLMKQRIKNFADKNLLAHV